MNRKALPVILAFFLLMACSEKMIEDNTITVAGRIAGLTEGTIRIMGEEELPGTGIGSDGSILLKFDHHDSHYFTIRTPDNTIILFLSPGDSIFVEFDTNDFDNTFRASGDKAREAEYLVQKNTLMGESGLSDMMKLMSQQPDGYLRMKVTGIGLLRELLDGLKAEKDVDSEFIGMEDAGIEYTGLYNDYLYPVYHRRIHGLAESEDIGFDEDLAAERIAMADYDNTAIIKSPAGRQLLDIRISSVASEIREQDSAVAASENAWIISSLKAADSLLGNPRVRDFVKFNTLKGNMEYRGPSRYKDLYSAFLAENTTPAYEESINRIIGQWEPISPGTEVPDFAFSDIDGNEVRLSDLSGQLIYIDVWATWCGPCIREHPYWDTLMEEYEDADVAFLTVSIDNSREPWEKMVAEKNMGGYTWFAENAWQSELAEHFMIRGIPRFLLLDRERRIIDPSAERPSGRIRETLNEHL